MTNLSPHDIQKFQKWLTEKKDFIIRKVGFLVGEEAINYVFSILEAELIVEFNQEDKKFSDEMQK